MILVVHRFQRFGIIYNNNNNKLSGHSVFISDIEHQFNYAFLLSFDFLYKLHEIIWKNASYRNYKKFFQ